MKKLLISVFVALSLLGSAQSAQKTAITLESLQKMFGDMRANTKWNIDGPLFWGYFFTDPDPKKLEPVAKVLTESGYRFVNIYPTDNQKTYFLHVEKVELLTPESLNERNQEFYQLAAKFHLESYDGMDVGPAE